MPFPQTDMTQPDALRQLANAYVQGNQQNQLLELNVAKQRQDNENLSNIASIFGKRLTSANDNEIQSILGIAQTALAPYAEHPASKFVAQGLQSVAEGRKSEIKSQKEKSLTDQMNELSKSGVETESPLPATEGSPLTQNTSRPANTSDYVKLLSGSGLVPPEKSIEMMISNDRAQNTASTGIVDENGQLRYVPKSQVANIPGAKTPTMAAQQSKPTKAAVYVDAEGNYVAAGTPGAKPYQDRVGDTTRDWIAEFDKEGKIVPSTMNPRTATTARVGGSNKNTVEQAYQAGRKAFGDKYKIDPIALLNGNQRLTRTQLKGQMGKDLDKFRPVYAKWQVSQGDTLGAAGGAPPVKAPPSQALSTEDQQAVDWARQNPSDPRSAQILKLHGLQ